MSIKTKQKEFYKDVEESITEMINSDLEFSSCVILAFSEDKTFNSFFGKPIDLIKLFAAWSHSGNAIHTLLAKIGFELGMKMKKAGINSEEDLDEFLKNFKP